MVVTLITLAEYRMLASAMLDSYWGCEYVATTACDRFLSLIKTTVFFEVTLYCS